MQRHRRFTDERRPSPLRRQDRHPAGQRPPNVQAARKGVAIISGKKKNRYQNAKDKRPPGAFVALSHIVIRSDQWMRLSPFAVKLLIDLFAQYNGNNNGDLTTAWTVMHRRGWKSKATLYGALRELDGGGWIQCTRQGGRHVASLWAVTMFALDDNNPTVKAKLGILPGDFNRGAWARSPIGPPPVPIDGDSSAPLRVPIAAELARDPYQTNAPDAAIGPSRVPVETVSSDSLARHAHTSIELPSLAGDLPHPVPPADVGVDVASALELPARRDQAAKTADERERSRERYQKGLARRARAAAKRQQSNKAA